MVLKLKDATGTIYLTDDYAPRVKYILDIFLDEIKCKESTAVANIQNDADKHVVDIAQTRFTGPVWDALRKAFEDNYQVLVIRDSEDIARDEFLKGLYLTLKLRDVCIEYTGCPDLPSIELPLLPTKWEEIHQWLEDLRTDIVYRTIRYQDNPEVLSLILLMKPEVKIWAYNRTLFRYLADKCSDILPYQDEYLYIISETDEYWIARVDANDMVAVPNVEPMTRADFLKKYLCIPAMFQRQYMGQVDPSMKPAVKSIFNDVRDLINRQEITISSYYKEAKDGD